MEEINNMDMDDVLEVIREFPVQPLGRRVIITLNTEQPDGNLVLAENSLAEVQFAVAVGSHNKDIKAGNKVVLDLEKMMEFVQSTENSHERVGSIKLRPIKVNNRVYGLISDNVIDAIDNR